MDIAVTASALFLALLFIDVFIDIFITAATKLVVPYGMRTLLILSCCKFLYGKNCQKKNDIDPKKCNESTLKGFLKTRML